MNLSELLAQRSSYYDYDATEIISDDVIKQIVSQAILAPTAYHMQNVKFIAVTSSLQKETLFNVAFQQEKIRKAPVTFIICGDEQGYLKLQRNLQPSLLAGQINEQFAQNLIQGATDSHSHNPQLRRDEAIRSASLARMTLILAAEDMRYATGAMSGFEADKL